MLIPDQLPDILHSNHLSRLNSLLVILAVEKKDAKRVNKIKEIGRQAGCTEIHRWNVSDILRRSNGLAINLPEGWSLTSKGVAHLNDLGILKHLKQTPKVINHAEKLKREVSKIIDVGTKEFVEEAIKAYEFGLYRSSIVLSWVGAMSLLYDHVMDSYLDEFNKEAKRRDPKWKDAKIKDDLSRMKESAFLDIIGSPPLSVIGKNIKEELKNTCLRLRNSCGHPNSFKVGENVASAHLEVLILNIFGSY